MNVISMAFLVPGGLAPAVFQYFSISVFQYFSISVFQYFSISVFNDDINAISYLSNVIIKFNDNFSVEEIGDDYKNKIAGNNFTTLSYDDSTDTSGEWEYNNGDYTYPDIRFWIAKTGEGGWFLNWKVDTLEIGIDSNCKIGTNVNDDSDFSDPSNFSFACMNLAQSVTAGTWSTPNNNKHGLSHITFFGGLCTQDEIDNSENGCAGTTTSVPEPTSIALFALALFGIAARRKKFTS
jgi:hypothetical protein